MTIRSILLENNNYKGPTVCWKSISAIVFGVCCFLATQFSLLNFYTLTSLVSSSVDENNTTGAGFPLLPSLVVATKRHDDDSDTAVTTSHNNNNNIGMQHNAAHAASADVDKNSCRQQNWPTILLPKSGNHSLTKQQQSPPNKNPPPRPWIHIGVPKTGTTSLQQFWSCGGLKVSHHTCLITDTKDDTNSIITNTNNASSNNRSTLRQILLHGNASKYVRCPKKKGKPKPHKDCVTCGGCMKAAVKAGLPPLASCGNYDAYTQLDASRNTCYWPQLSALEDIHQESPTATFVLMMRDPNRWATSVKQFAQGKMHHAFVKCDLPFLPAGNGTEAVDLQIFYCNVVQSARDFVTRYPSHRLIEINLDDPNVGLYLNETFGIDKECWGEHNVNVKKQEEQ